MSGYSTSALRARQIRWQDELAESVELNRLRAEMNRSPDPNYYQELNNELYANEQRVFQQQSGGDLDLFPRAPYTLPPPSSRAALPSELRYRESPPSPTLISSANPPQNSHSPEYEQGYMAQASAFTLDSPPTESMFLESFPKGNATLTYQDEDGKLESIRDVNISLVEKRSPILGMAFESGRSGPHLYLETLTSTTAMPFLRYLYTGTYALRGITGEAADYYEDVPTSVLFHCRMYRLADIYDLPDLKSQAYVNVIRQCEFGCSSPDKPIDLCAAIRFVYENLKEHENMIDALVNYCVSCFLQHQLAEDDEFKKLAYDLRPFHQALCRNSIDREFENETAQAIVQMPFKPYIPDTYASREDVAVKKVDDILHFHSSDRFDKMKKRRRPEVTSESKDWFSLAFRPRTDPWVSADGNLPVKDEDYKFGSKRRASSIAKDEPPVVGGISQLRVMNPDPVDSDPEYDIVERPVPTVVTDDSDSDSSGFVEVKREEATIKLPIRAHMPVQSAPAEPEESSDSEWSLV